MTASLAAYYYVVLRDQNFQRVAMFDTWNALSYARTVNDVDTYSLTLQSDDPRVELFRLDGIVQIFRAVPGLGVGWHQEFIGLHRSIGHEVTDNGERLFSSSGVGLNDLLARTIVNFKSGTIRAYKKIAGETAIKEYVAENCGALATVANGREVEGVLPNFDVEASSGYGSIWEGDRAFENLLDVLKEIATASGIDYGVFWSELTNRFTFRTFPDQIGSDRTVVGLDPITGLNGAGLTPIIFSLENGTLANFEYEYNRINEANVVSVLGDGDGATRIVQVRSAASTADSPWNRREISRPENGFLSQMQAAGDAILQEQMAQEVISFTPLQQQAQAYGKHYFWGDKVSVYFRGRIHNRRITNVSNNVTSSGTIKLEFSQI